MPAALSARNSKTYRATQRHDDGTSTCDQCCACKCEDISLGGWVGGYTSLANLAFNMHSRMAYHGMLGAGQITILDSCLQGLLACGVQRYGNEVNRLEKGKGMTHSE